MVAFRSHLFNLLFYLSLAVWLVPASLTFFMPRRAIIRVAQAWGRYSVWLLGAVVGTRVEFRGLDRIPQGGLLVASKHQSFLETFALLSCLDDPTIILKRELQWIPVFGWLTIKARLVPVVRGKPTAMAEMLRRATAEARRGRQILIFPEGTRRMPGAEPAYKYGVGQLYRALDVPCVPVALNTGSFWPRRHYLRRPGTAVIEFCEPIPAGLEREEFMAVLIERVEGTSTRLLAEAEADLVDEDSLASATS